MLVEPVVEVVQPPVVNKSIGQVAYEAYGSDHDQNTRWDTAANAVRITLGLPFVGGAGLVMKEAYGKSIDGNPSDASLDTLGTSWEWDVLRGSRHSAWEAAAAAAEEIN